MPDTLLSFVSAMNGIPDNTSKLISPQDARQAWLSITRDRGSANYDGVGAPLTIPLVQNVWQDVPQGILAAGGGMEEGVLPLFWRMDANGHLAYDYTADWPTTIVPPGYERHVGIVAELEVQLASASDVYEFAVSIDGVQIPPVFSLDEASLQTETWVTFVATTALEVAAAPLVSVSVRNIDGAAALGVVNFGCLASGGIPA